MHYCAALRYIPRHGLSPSSVMIMCAYPYPYPYPDPYPYLCPSRTIPFSFLHSRSFLFCLLST